MEEKKAELARKKAEYEKAQRDLEPLKVRAVSCLFLRGSWAIVACALQTGFAGLCVDYAASLLCVWQHTCSATY